jgi:serine/threonine-protein kinase
MKPNDFVEIGYTIVRELGRGTTGVVYEALHSALGRQVAIKISSDGHSTRAMREAQSHASVRNDHDNIVVLYGFGEHWGRFFLVRELVIGHDFQHALQSRSATLTESVGILEGIARAVEAVHCRGLIHRNLVASNVLISQDGTAKLIGFGRAKLRDDNEEVARSQIAADIASLGRMIVSVASQLGKPLPEFLDAVCMKCEKAGSEWGYKSAAELATDLERFESES